MKYLYFFLVTMLFFTSCQEDEPMWFDNQYVFLEQHLSVYNEVIKGKYYGNLQYDGGGYYQFNSEARTLEGILFSVDDSWLEVGITGKTQILLATGVQTRGDVEGGTAIGVYEVHDFPATVGGITIKNIDKDGTVHFTDKDSSMVLSPNEEWSVLTTKMDTSISQHEDWETQTTFNDTLIVKWTYHDRITNWGKLEKESFNGQPFE